MRRPALRLALLLGRAANIYLLGSASYFGSDLVNGWTGAEFNVFGDPNDSHHDLEASFESGAVLQVQLLLNDGSLTQASSQPATFTQEYNNLTIVPQGSTGCTFGGPTPGIQFTEALDPNAPALPCSPPAQAVSANSNLGTSGGLAAIQQNLPVGGPQTDLFTIDESGAIDVTYATQNEPWSLPSTIPNSPSSPGFQPGSLLVATPQYGGPSGQIDVLSIDNNGYLEVSTGVGQSWNAPVQIGNGQLTPGCGGGGGGGGGGLAASQQFGASPAQTDVFTVDNYGAITVNWVVGSGSWQSEEITPRNLFLGGTPVAAAQELPKNRTDVFAVDESGHIDVVSFDAGGTQWSAPQSISGSTLFGSYTSIAASQQFGLSQVDVFAVDNNGNLDVFYNNNNSGWNGPTCGSSPCIPTGQTFEPGAPVVASQQLDLTQTDIFAVNSAGTLIEYYVGTTDLWQGPVLIPPPAGGGITFGAGNYINLATSFQTGADFQVSNSSSGLTDVFAIDNNDNGLRTVSWFAQGGTAWKGPNQIPGCLPGVACPPAK